MEKHGNNAKKKEVPQQTDVGCRELQSQSPAPFCNDWRGTTADHFGTIPP